jgi:ERCC4-type nuclease
VIVPLVSPTEPVELLEALEGVTSSLPEEYGCDVLLHSRHGVVGIQRKTVPDLMASLEDGRLAHELHLMRAANAVMYVLVVEGRFVYDPQGRLTRGVVSTRYDRRYIANLLLSLQAAHGMVLERTDNVHHTGVRVLEILGWLDSGEYSSLSRRPSVKSDDGWYGKPTAAEMTRWFYQGIPGVGPRLAKVLCDAFPLPESLVNASKEDMTALPGIGKPTAKRIWGFLHGDG